jgi:hypothetical protein
MGFSFRTQGAGWPVILAFWPRSFDAPDFFDAHAIGILRTIATDIGFQPMLVCIAIDQKVGIVGVRLIAGDNTMLLDFLPDRQRGIMIKMDFGIAENVAENGLQSFIWAQHPEICRGQASRFWLKLSPRYQQANVERDMWARQFHLSESSSSRATSLLSDVLCWMADCLIRATNDGSSKTFNLTRFAAGPPIAIPRRLFTLRWLLGGLSGSGGIFIGSDRFIAWAAICRRTLGGIAAYFISHRRGD